MDKAGFCYLNPAPIVRTGEVYLYEHIKSWGEDSSCIVRSSLITSDNKLETVKIECVGKTENFLPKLHTFKRALGLSDKIGVVFSACKLDTIDWVSPMEHFYTMTEENTANWLSEIQAVKNAHEWKIGLNKIFEELETVKTDLTTALTDSS